MTCNCSGGINCCKNRVGGKIPKKPYDFGNNSKEVFVPNSQVRLGAPFLNYRNITEEEMIQYLKDGGMWEMTVAQDWDKVWEKMKGGENK